MTQNLNMEATTALVIPLILSTVTLVHVLSMEDGQPGHHGVTAAEHVQMAQEFATELVVIPFHNSGEEIALVRY